MKRTIFLILITLSLFNTTIYSQIKSQHIEANYLFEFARMIQWQNYKNNKIIINVLGESLVPDYINNIAVTNTANGKEVIARNTQISNALNCNILFITTQQENALLDISTMPSSNVLIVFEGDPMLSFPADVSFNTKITSSGDSILTYKINLNSIKSKNFKVSPDFIGYGLLQ